MNDRPLVSIDKIASGAELATKKGKPDAQDALEENTLEISKLQAEVDALQQNNADRVANRSMRETYAKKVYRYLIGYSASCMALLLLCGFKSIGFTLPDTVLTVVVGSTAAAAIGLVGFVVNGLFKNSN
jgi:hypothetical protein